MSKRNSRGELSKGSPQNGPESFESPDKEGSKKKRFTPETAPSSESPHNGPDSYENPDKEGFKKKKFTFEPAKGAEEGPKKGIQIRLGSSQKMSSGSSTVKPKSRAVAAAFNLDDDDSEPEEMPPEARMRMRNIGRETPTSVGPNSFGKTKQGFCDFKKMFEKTMKKAMDTCTDPNSKVEES